MVQINSNAGARNYRSGRSRGEAALGTRPRLTPDLDPLQRTAQNLPGGTTLEANPIPVNGAVNWIRLITGAQAEGSVIGWPGGPIQTGTVVLPGDILLCNFFETKGTGRTQKYQLFTYLGVDLWHELSAVQDTANQHMSMQAIAWLQLSVPERINRACITALTQLHRARLAMPRTDTAEAVATTAAIEHYTQAWGRTPQGNNPRMMEMVRLLSSVDQELIRLLTRFLNDANMIQTAIRRFSEATENERRTWLHILQQDSDIDIEALPLVESPIASTKHSDAGSLRRSITIRGNNGTSNDTTPGVNLGEDAQQSNGDC